MSKTQHRPTSKQMKEEALKSSGLEYRRTQQS